MKVNANKCGFVAVESDGLGAVTDLPLEVGINGKKIPKLGSADSYKYLGYCMNVDDTHFDTASIMKKKLETNLRIIDSIPVHKWHKVALTQWMINSIPMYYLVNGRVNVRRFGKWNRETRKMVRGWLGARCMTNSAIHLPASEHGLGIMDIEDINDERKLTLFTQLLYSADNRLRRSTVGNIRMELGRRRVVLNEGYDVLMTPKVGDKGGVRKYTLIWCMEKLLKKYGLKLMVRKEGECWCAFPLEMHNDMSQCVQCGKYRHSFCDPTVRDNRPCRKCTRDTTMDVAREHPLTWKKYQNNRYNWKEHIVPMPNPVWEISMAKEEGPCKHHVFQQGNGVWGVTSKRIKNLVKTEIKAGEYIRDERVLVEILRVIDRSPGVHLEIVLNRKGICKALGNWAYSWANKFQRTTTGVEPAMWRWYRSVLERIRDRLPWVTVLTFNNMGDTKNNVERG